MDKQAALEKFRETIKGFSSNTEFIERAALQLHYDLLPDELITERLIMKQLILHEFDKEAEKSRLEAERLENEIDKEIEPD